MSNSSFRIQAARGRKLKYLFLLAAIVPAGCSDTTGPEPWERGDILDRLNGLPGVTATEIQPYYGYPRAFQSIRPSSPWQSWH